ncbi:hypothetical protein AB0E10_38025 [Streptomyces sp. NPDC048045]|uniref:hypothetical protein n=1 Tax=Streptomyces sp. NPDC048045 TaxID=3154710 RepID=UPI00342A52AB
MSLGHLLLLLLRNTPGSTSVPCSSRSAQSLHPKIDGARLYANSLERTMAGMGL